MLQDSGSQSGVSAPAVGAPPGNWIKMQVLRLHSRLAKSEILGKSLPVCVSTVLQVTRIQQLLLAQTHFQRTEDRKGKAAILETWHPHLDQVTKFNITCANHALIICTLMQGNEKAVHLCGLVHKHPPPRSTHEETSDI